MASYNRVILMGNLSREIEMKYTQSGTAIGSTSLAINDKRKGQDGSWVEEVSFVDLTAFGKTAELMNEYLSKGSSVFIEGKLKQDTWENNGQKRSKLHVIVDQMKFVGAPQGQRQQGPPPQQQYQQSPQGPPPQQQYRQQGPPPQQQYQQPVMQEQIPF